MFVMVCRTIIVRVLPDSLIVFEPKTIPVDPEDGLDDDADSVDDQRSFYTKVKTGLKEGGSLFAWADTGKWVTAERATQEAKREGDSFRIGFEPIFVDFTKTGSWFMAFSLFQVRTCRSEMFTFRRHPRRLTCLPYRARARLGVRKT